MKTLHVGGVADAELLDLHDNVLSGRHSFRLSTDLPAEPLRHHDYTRHVFEMRAADGRIERRELMVWDRLSDQEASALVAARFQQFVVSHRALV